MAGCGLAAPALPPDDAQCAGYGYTRAFFFYRDGGTVRADPYIGGLNGLSPCGFWVKAVLRSPSGRVITAEDVEGGNFRGSFANVSVVLNAGADAGSYTGNVQWKVEDDTVVLFRYYTPAPRSDWRAACSSSGDDRERLILEYPAYGLTYLPTCAEFTQTSRAQSFTFNELAPNYSWAILRDELFTGADSTRTSYGSALTVNSGYRSPSHNASIPRSSTSSRHMFGDAVDFASDAATWRNLCLAGRAAKACVEPQSRSGTGHLHLQWAGSCPAKEWKESPPEN